MYGLEFDWCSEAQAKPRHLVLEDYEGGVPRWCPGCGDHAALSAVQRLARDRQLLPEKTVVVSGIGCSSRFPHYMKTFGFHGLHGRPFPIACGIRSRRPDLDIFVVTGMVIVVPSVRPTGFTRSRPRNLHGHAHRSAEARYRRSLFGSPRAFAL